jgi:hypothetical protein
MQALRRLILDPFPLRTLAIRAIKKFGLGSYTQRLELGAVDRPHYAYCVYNAALLAKRLNYGRISVIEFGVAGGKGLLNLEQHATTVSELLGVGIDVYGFDTGEGLTEPIDYRDLPYHWKKGFYKLDQAKLRTQLRKAMLVLGDVRETSADFFARHDPAPIGAISFDLDLYSSTAGAMGILDAEETRFLPRVFCYFDDTTGTEVELYNDYTGERLAIEEFNRAHEGAKFSRAYHLLSRQIVEPWYHKVWICHFFSHSRYNDFVSTEGQELSI